MFEDALIMTHVNIKPGLQICVSRTSQILYSEGQCQQKCQRQKQMIKSAYAYLCKHINLSSWLPFMDFDDPVHNGNVPLLKLENNNFPNSKSCPASVYEQNISWRECRPHTPSQDNSHLHSCTLLYDATTSLAHNV